MRFDPSVRGTITRKKPKKVAPYNTRLDTGKNTMQASCKCFGRTSQGSCAGHYADLWLREAAAEQALQEACGAAFDLGARLKAAEGLLEAALKVATLVPEADRLVCSPDGSPRLPPVRAVVQIDGEVLHRVKLALADIGKDHVVAEPTKEQE
jgi:hypothetical protein